MTGPERLICEVGYDHRRYTSSQPNPEAALKGIRALVKSTIKDMVENGEFIPEPMSSKKYSGKFMVRVPPEVHRHLAIEAAESGVSLNRLASAKLAQ